jgi:hypothetical protein
MSSALSPEAEIRRAGCDSRLCQKLTWSYPAEINHHRRRQVYARQVDQWLDAALQAKQANLANKLCTSRGRSKGSCR